MHAAYKAYDLAAVCTMLHVDSCNLYTQRLAVIMSRLTGSMFKLAATSHLACSCSVVV
jgi:hypothetical protein